MTTNVPEKLYFGSKQRPNKEIFHVFTTPVENDDIEYIRTDAFIEKAISWLKEQDEMIGVSFQEDFLERFQDYMKEE